MRALIFAAGRGERMRPLTDHTPKPLLQVKGRALIEWHLQALARAGVREVAINTAWLEECFEPALGDGSKWGLALHFSKEGRDHGGALETAGGMAKLLPWLTDNGRPAFWAVSADVYLPNFTFDPDAAARFTQSSAWAHLWMTANAPHHPHGDFGITPQGWATLDTEPRWTWTSIGLFKPVLIKGLSAGTVSPLRPWLNRAISQQRISAEIYAGPWTDVGTPERLAALETSAP
jgi:MurNAc alpha-1-phosphate uridylyltransferase